MCYNKLNNNVRRGDKVLENRKNYQKKSYNGKNAHFKTNKSERKEYSEDIEKEDNGMVVGRNAVRELLKSQRPVDKIYVKKGGAHEGSITVIISEAISKGIPIVEVEAQMLDYIAQGSNHQGIVAQAAMKEYSSIDDMLELAAERGEKPLIVIADSMLGEITEKMAIAVGKADAVRILLPINRCDNLVAGIPDVSTATILDDVILKVKKVLG